MRVGPLKTIQIFLDKHKKIITMSLFHRLLGYLEMCLHVPSAEQKSLLRNIWKKRMKRTFSNTKRFRNANPVSEKSEFNIMINFDGNIPLQLPLAHYMQIREK